MIQEIIEQMEHRMIIEANATNAEANKSSSVSGLTILPLSKSNLDQYKQTREGRYLCHFNLNDKSKGFIATSNGKLAGAICVETASDGKKWVQALEVTEEFQRKGVGRELLKMAMEKLQASHLSVRKTNKQALHLYISMGFKAYKDTGYQWLMSTQNMGSVIPVQDPIQKKGAALTKEYVNPFVKYYTESIEFNLNDDDTTINIENFERGIYNFILVIGLPGSGKGCVGKEMAKKYNAKHIELDVFDQCGNMSEADIRKAGEPFTSYIFNDPNGNWYWKNANTLSINEKLQGNRLFIEYVIAYAKVHRKEIFVIDGTPIYAAMEPEDIQNYPIIIKGTNAKNCFLNKVNRDLNDTSSDKKLHSKVSKDHLSGLLNYYWGDEDALKKFRRDLIEIPGEDINEACKDLATARKFVSEVYNS